MDQSTANLERIAGAFRASEKIFEGMGARLYAEFCRAGAGDPEMLALADQAMEGAKTAHLFSAVHYLLLGDPDDPLSRYFATLTEDFLPPEGAYPHLVRYCREHRDELLHLVRTRSVQTTYAERCRALLAPMCVVADEAGEPLNLVEIGCSAGVLLVFDKFAYVLNDQGLIGARDAPLLLEGELHGGPALRIPRIGTRTGLDLHTIDARSEEERRWLLALCFPELRDEQARLARALDVIAATDIRMLEGDALEHIVTAMAETPDPLCVFHSACLFYWTPEGRAALEDIFLEASRTREFWRIGIEPSEVFDNWHKGDSASDGHPRKSPQRSGAISITHYHQGKGERRVAGQPNADYGIIDWFG